MHRNVVAPTRTASLGKCVLRGRCPGTQSGLEVLPRYISLSDAPRILSYGEYLKSGLARARISRVSLPRERCASKPRRRRAEGTRRGIVTPLATPTHRHRYGSGEIDYANFCQRIMFDREGMEALACKIAARFTELRWGTEGPVARIRSRVDPDGWLPGRSRVGFERYASSVGRTAGGGSSAGGPSWTRARCVLLPPSVSRLSCARDFDLLSISRVFPAGSRRSIPIPFPSLRS